MLRILLVLVMLVGLSVSGCKKEEPTPAEQMQQMKEEAEKTGEEMAQEAEEMGEEAQKAAEEAAEHPAE